MRELTSISAETFFMELLNMALLATWIMLAVILFRAILKKWLPRRVVILGWLLVVFRLVCPFTIESVVSLIPSGKPIPMDIPYSQTPTIHVGVPLIDKPVNSLLTEHMAPTPEVSVNPLQIAFTVAFVIWLIGVAALLVYTILSYILLRRRVRLAVKLSANERLPHSATLWQSEAVNSPFILGMFKPRIYLPYGMDDETLTHVLAHESAHLRRLDHITKLLAFLVCTVYWFHPLVWVCYVLFCRDMEAACDERVVKDMDDMSRRAYAHVLLSCASGRRMRPFCPPAFGETDVKSRIKGVLSYKKPLLWLIVAAILILAVLGVFLLTDPVETYQESVPHHFLYDGCPISDVEGFTLYAVKFTWSEEHRLASMDMCFSNATGDWIGYGEPFAIYREESGEWVDVSITDDVFHLPMYHLPHGQNIVKTYDVSNYDLSKPGLYRFVVSITVPINEYGATETREAIYQFGLTDDVEDISTPYPADFAIRFETQIGKVPNVLDTFDGYIQKNLVTGIPNTATCDYTPTEAELQYLWYLVESHGITSMPSDMHPKQNGNLFVTVQPNTRYTITVRANGTTYTVTGDSGTCMTEGEMNQLFRSFVGQMSNLLRSTDQWKSLPDAKGGYE